MTTKNKYQPNLQDPRILKRVLSSLDWVSTYLQPHKDNWLSAREIQRQLGSQSRPLGVWLRNTLLVCVNPYYNTEQGICKTYRLNVDGYSQLCNSVGYTAKYTPTPEITKELILGVFEYTAKSHREYHPLQNLPKRVKRPLLAQHGYRYEYDIQCCAQTLLLQHARKLGFKKSTPALDQYIQDRTLVRQQLSKRSELDTATIKKILTAILNGGSISTWYENLIFSYVDYNTIMIEYLKQDDYIVQYQKDVRAMWSYIRSHRGLEKGERFNAKMKSELYRELEGSVRTVVRTYLRRTGNKAFVEHDGWTCDKAVDISRLCYEVKRQTGFVIELDWTIFEYE